MKSKTNDNLRTTDGYIAKTHKILAQLYITKIGELDKKSDTYKKDRDKCYNAAIENYSKAAESYKDLENNEKEQEMNIKVALYNERLGDIAFEEGKYDEAMYRYREVKKSPQISSDKKEEMDEKLALCKENIKTLKKRKEIPFLIKSNMKRLCIIMSKLMDPKILRI
ncbi:MAG: hypothetical protein RCG15_00835 [Candidatus Rickettsia vulgarisii]